LGFPDNTASEWEQRPHKLPLSQYATQLLLENKGIKLIVEEDEGKVHELTLQVLITGVEHYIKHDSSVDMDDIDATAADMIFQYALFGEIAYG